LANPFGNDCGKDLSETERIRTASNGHKKRSAINSAQADDAK